MRKYLPNYKKIGPVQQGLFIILLITLASLACIVCRQKGMTAWNLILSPVFLYCFYNPVLGMFQQKLLQYFATSSLILILVAIYIYIAGNFISEFSYRQSDELHYMAALVITFYLLFNLLCLLFRGILYVLNEIDN